jgi:hypothetical protein
LLKKNYSLTLSKHSIANFIQGHHDKFKGHSSSRGFVMKERDQAPSQHCVGELGFIAKEQMRIRG